MPELLRVQTESWELSIWGVGAHDSQLKYFQTLAKRGVVGPLSPARIDFSSNVKLFNEIYSACGAVVRGSEILLSAPLLFENSHYQIEILFHNEDVCSAAVEHRLQSVNESFHFSAFRKASHARLSGAFNTGNNVGWLVLPFSFSTSSHRESFTVSVEVLPTKMDLHSDLSLISRQIDEIYPLWRFSIAEQTEHEASKGQGFGSFPIMWLAQFRTLVSEFEAGLMVVNRSPHSRLRSQTHYRKAERLRGRINERVCERIRGDLSSGATGRYYKKETKFLSVDTPENQFVKHVVASCRRSLSVIHEKISTAMTASPYKRLSSNFFTEIDRWRNFLTRYSQQGFLQEVSEFSGGGQDSLVLQYRVGYSSVYRVWQQLRFYLDFFASDSLISVKPISELYEVWCFLTLRSILIDHLGFSERPAKVDRLLMNDLFEYQLKDGVRGAFYFERADGVSAVLAHEPIFKSNGIDIRSFTVAQKPDIFLDVSFSSGKRCVWLFDAKYRIKTDRSRLDLYDVDAFDCVPDDALNQMHRYRDALISMSNCLHEGRSRPVFGAFALYPGFYDQSNGCNPYSEAIDQIGVGAFPLLPSSGHERFSCKWLIDFLVSNLCVESASQAKKPLSDIFYLQNLLRVPVSGMRQVLYSDLVLVAPWVSAHHSFSGMLTSGPRIFFLSYHCLLDDLDANVLKEICFLAFLVQASGASSAAEIGYLWPVKSASIVQEEDKSGYLFELGEPLGLQQTITLSENRPAADVTKLTTISGLERVRFFDGIPAVYA